MSIHTDVLDVAAIRELRDILGARLDEVLVTFREQAHALMAALEGQLRAGDLATARSTAHQLKSAAGSVGAARLAEQAGQVEYAALQGDRLAATHAAAQLPAVATATVTALSSVATQP
ncbi:Hpt domain-containing protein [Gemmatimonas sp.]|jgi:HPt (histidine-containing phosphotransfer) domain-containing protein|uniref:Hpt domain-containing protein n=1 Tax=Gemmatimonas sp. TaxID=1962908 RepID=UPI0031C8A00F|nr:Hpt domain-containing protein [Gemmatimonas sp.]